jgi:hypothetical protein
MVEDFEPLFAVAADPLIRQQHPEPTHCQRRVFQRFFDGGLAAGAIAIGYTFPARTIGALVKRRKNWVA